MGVMSCSRRHCSNIMCDTYVNDIGYICTSCQQEFKDYLSGQQKTPATEGEIKQELKLFMKTDKDTHKKGKEMSVDEFFSEYTK